MRCAEARKDLASLHDAGRSPGPRLSEHLGACAGCSAFAAFLGSFAGEAREALDAAWAGLPRPDYSRIVRLAAPNRVRAAAAARRRPGALALAAAAVVAGIGIAAGARAWVAQRERLMIASSVTGFVDELFAEALLADAGSLADDQAGGLRDWLEGSGAPGAP